MNVCMQLFAIAGILYYFETKRETVYFKKSRIARLPITLTKIAIVLGFIALVAAYNVYFVNSMFSC